MKGTILLILGETPKQHKLWLLERIKTNKGFITRINALEPSETALKQQIEALRAEIKTVMKELIELERWRKKNGYDPNQPYVPPSYQEFLDDMDEVSREAYIVWQADIQTEIDRLESMNGK